MIEYHDRDCEGITLCHCELRKADSARIAALEARCRELEAALIYMLDFAMIGAVHREDDEKIEAACKLVGYQSETTVNDCGLSGKERK